MRFATIFAIISAMGFAALAIPAPVPEAADALEQRAAEAAPEDFDFDLDEEPTLAKRGFGCTFFGGNDKPCHRHCKSIKGYRGGYCKFGGVCKCYK